MAEEKRSALPSDNQLPAVLRGRVGPEQAGRIDQYLPLLHPQLSRRQARNFIEIGGVHVDGRRMQRCGFLLRPGAEVELFIDRLPLRPWELTPDTILYQDRELLVIDKPAGLPCQPTPARFKGTVYQGVKDYLCQGRPPAFRPSIGMVQRLDQETTGVMIFSVHPAAHGGLTAQFNQRRVEKLYLALVSGDPGPVGEFNSLLARNRKTNRVRSVARGGKPALTRYRRLGRIGADSLVAVALETGRMHQIRAHFAEAGHPLLGDRRYEGPTQRDQLALPRPMLHALSLGLTHPVKGKPLRWIAAPPADFLNLWQQGAGEGEPWSGLDYHRCFKEGF